MVTHYLCFQINGEILFQVSEDHPIPIPRKNEVIEHGGIHYRVDKLIHNYIYRKNGDGHSLDVETDLYLEVNQWPFWT